MGKTACESSEATLKVRCCHCGLRTLLALAAAVILILELGLPPILGGEKARVPGGPQADTLLTPHVEVTRVGRVLYLDYQLLSESGRNQVREVLQQGRNTPPRVTVWQDGREIASGTFEYG
jgi:hypothetical protein